MKSKYKVKNAGIMLILLIIGFNSRAQLSPMGSQFYQNQYLGNPAMAGIEKGIQFNLGVRQQWSSLPGAPLTQVLTAEYGMEKVGWGLNLYNDEAGLLKRTRTSGTYAYHLPLNNEEQKLHFGISLGFMYERVMNEILSGDQDDQTVGRFNLRETYIDGDFGFAYTNKRLTLQAAVPNLKNFLKKDKNNPVDRSLFYTSISYKWFTGPDQNDAVIEPKVAYRGVKGYHNLVDAGLSMSLINRRVHMTGMYHSSKSATYGLGLSYENLSFMGSYTTETSILRTYTGGNFEMGIKYRLGKK